MSTNDGRDPRSEAEKARADLKRNAQMDMSPQYESDRKPSVTPETFGEHPNVEYETGPVDRENRDDPLPEAP
jgi:hypothetical protein